MGAPIWVAPEGWVMRGVSLWGSIAVLAAIVLVPASAAGAGNGSQPAAKGGLDCNGFSPLQTTYRQLWCTEIAANDENGFEDNGHYVGHDEPDIGFFSNRHGSANSMSYTTILPRDPLSTPTVAFGGSTSMFELTPAIWFGMTLCDNESYPEGTKICTPDSDSNIQVPPRPDHAGAAFMELQLYPPGYAPIISCDQRALVRRADDRQPAGELRWPSRTRQPARTRWRTPTASSRSTSPS